MRNTITNFIPGLLAAALLAGCSQGELSEHSELNISRPANPVSAVVEDPCAVVLVPFASREPGSASSIDTRIARHQRAASGEFLPLHRFEQLGWAFVEKARDTRDPGYYKLAELTASCIESQAADSAEALLLRGHVLHNLHRFREAEALARQLVEQRGVWFDFALLGDVLVERGALDAAVEAYQTVIDQRPGPQAYARVAQVRWLKGDLDGALDMMALAVSSSSPRTPEAAAWTHVRLALLLMQADELPAADAVLVSALSLKPEYPPALHARGRLLLAQDQPLAAIPLLRQAVHAEPVPEFRWTFYEALLAAGQQAAADEQVAALQQTGVIEDRRTFALFLATTGGEPEAALRLARQELEQREDVFTLDAVAWALSAAGLNAEALDFSRRALAEGTQDARLNLHAGVIAARIGDSERALEFLHKAKATQQMLLPSERQQLVNEFAVLQPRIPARSTAKPVSRIYYHF